MRLRTRGDSPRAPTRRNFPKRSVARDTTTVAELPRIESGKPRRRCLSGHRPRHAIARCWARSSPAPPFLLLLEGGPSSVVKIDGGGQGRPFYVDMLSSAMSVALEPSARSELIRRGSPSIRGRGSSSRTRRPPDGSRRRCRACGAATTSSRPAHPWQRSRRYREAMVSNRLTIASETSSPDWGYAMIRVSPTRTDALLHSAGGRRLPTLPCRRRH